MLVVLASFGLGGAERQALIRLRHLDRTRFEPFLYLISRQGPLVKECPGDVPIFAFEDRVRPPRLYFPGRIHRSQIRDLQSVTDEIRPDRLVTISLLMTLLAGGLSSPPTRWFAFEVCDPRRDFHDQITRFRGMKKRLLRQALRRATPVAVSEGVREGLSEFYRIPREHIEVLRNVIDLAQVESEAAEPGPELEAGCFHIVNVARMQPQKGQRHLVEAVRQLVHDRRQETVRLHFLGDGPLRGELEALVARHRLQDHVHFHGFHAKPPAFIARCDLFCLSSLFEGLPRSLLEAMATGTPVLSTDCPSGPREVLAEGRYGTLVPMEDPAALAEGIASILHDRSAARSRAIAAKQHVVEHYSSPAAAHLWHDLLSS